LTPILNKDRESRIKRLEQLRDEKRKQPGVEFPKAGRQKHLVIIRLDLTSVPTPPFSSSFQLSRQPSQPPTSLVKSKDALRGNVQRGLKRLCTLFHEIDVGKKKIDKLDKDGTLVQVALSKFEFSATVGFGISFFDKLSIPDIVRPKKMKSMPDHVGLGDLAPYSFAQTDLIIQLGSSSDVVNRWVFGHKLESQEKRDNHTRGVWDENTNRHVGELGDTPDIVSAIEGWAIVTDFHTGFQRMDGRNLIGFNDGVSNPNPGSGDQFDDVVWNTEKDEGRILKDGTYMVFQKIAHDLDQWRELSSKEQEEWVGRSKLTGLLLGTPENEDTKFVDAVKNNDPAAREKLRKLIEEQSDPGKPFYDSDSFKNNVPAWSHIRKANPRQEKLLPGGKRIDKRLIFRRGYLFTEGGLNNKIISGLLFISFQRDIENSFEFIRKNWLNQKKFPTPEPRPFTRHELKTRHSHGRLSTEELEKIMRDLSKNYVLGLDDSDVLKRKIEETEDDDAQNTGKEGLAGPSKLGVIPAGEFLAIIPYGGGYYFIPPIPDKSMKDIGQQFFSKVV
jgi:Dyp-type peroxidase family